MAYSALRNSLRRTDQLDRKWYSAGRETYAPLRSGMFTLADMERVFLAWRAGERYVYGLGVACERLLETFFAGATGSSAARGDVAQIFAAILNAVQAAECVPVTQRVGRPTHWMMDQFLQNIGALARAGYEITMRLTIDTEESDATCTTE
jgi:hypothetical protein